MNVTIKYKCKSNKLYKNVDEKSYYYDFNIRK
jgi:hypothetical protein